MVVSLLFILFFMSSQVITGQLLKQANQLKRSGRLDEAIALYHQVIEIHPNFAWTYYELGGALEKNSQHDEAEVAYQSAIDTNKKSALFSQSLEEMVQAAKNGDRRKNINGYSNDLQSFFEQNTGRVIHKWMHYFEIYERYFKRFRNKEVHFLEIGVSRGGSLQMWKNYFGEKARIYGVDVNPHCKKFEENQVKIFIGDQANREFWNKFKKEVPKIDILLDDGGHTMVQQINTFEEMFDHISANGIYMVEDVCTSYWHRFGGGYKNPNSFIEYSKDLIDALNAWYSQNESIFKVSEFTRQSYSINYYSSVVVIEKTIIEKPYHKKTGGLLL